ncbi:hypothetical protein [Antarcticirhabdus aurantiaca]|uniref:Uncharacterized protein n=1 Tax=Antarcticirhabdus aurantiaca TaxID=2606717 RepID=A0ACD4NME9_9HYPH|nr:hypothetical protein [Antarcticirhabdus aurantiaca]WAJ27872.1 hypothetical protein OXU80_24010 [Jeongeuplla avenae]
MIEGTDVNGDAICVVELGSDDFAARLGEDVAKGVIGVSNNVHHPLSRETATSVELPLGQLVECEAGVISDGAKRRIKHDAALLKSEIGKLNGHEFMTTQRHSAVNR